MYFELDDRTLLSVQMKYVKLHFCMHGFHFFSFLSDKKTNMAGKQFSVSVINLATSVSSNRIHQQISTESTRLNLLEQRKHALSEENLAITVSEGHKNDVVRLGEKRISIDV